MLVAALFCLGLAACGSDGEARGPSAYADPRPGPGDRVIKVDLNIYDPGTVPGGIGEPLQESARLAREWEALNPGWLIDHERIVLAGGGEGEWLKTQFISGNVPEIIQINAENAWPDISKGWYVPLDTYLDRPNRYVEGNERWRDMFANPALLDAKRAPDGKLYALSIDIVETGLIYRTSMLEEYGLGQFPDTWAGMLELFGKIKADGKVPMAASVVGGSLNLSSDWGQDILFEMIYHTLLPEMDIKPSSESSADYLGHYLEPAEFGFLFTKGFFTRRDPRWREMLRLLYEWRQYQPAEFKNTDPMRLFITGRSPVIWDSSWNIRRLMLDPYLNDLDNEGFEWSVAYLPPMTAETSRFAVGSKATVIGGAAMQLHVTNSAVNNGTLEKCIDYLMYMTRPESMKRMTDEAMVFIPNIKGIETAPHLKPFESIFRRPYCAIKILESLDGETKKYYRRMLDLYLNDGYVEDGVNDIDAFIADLENSLALWVEAKQSEAGWDFERFEQTWQERADSLLRELEPAP